MAGARHHDHAVGRDVADRGGLQHLRVRGQRQHRLAGLVAAGEVLETRHEAVAVARHQHEVGLQVAAGDRLERRARHQREASAQRFAVAARRRQAVHDRRVAAAGGIDERDLLGAARFRRREQAVAIAVAERGRVDVVALRRAHPAFFAEHDGHRLAGHQFGFAQRLRRAARDQRRAARVAELLRVGEQFVLDQLLELGLAGEDRADLVALDRELGLLVADLHFLQPRELAQLGLEDVVGLLRVEREARHQHRLGFVLAADDPDHFVQVEERDQETFQQVQAPFDLVEPVVEAAGHGVDAEREPLAEERLQVLDLRTPVQADHVEIDAETLLQVGGREQVAHQLLGVDAVAARDQHDAGRVGVVGLVADVLQPRQLLGAHLLRDLLDDLARRGLVRHRGDDEVGPLAHPGRASAHAAQAGLVHGEEVGARGDDLGGGRVVRAEHVFAQVGHARVGVFEQAHAGADDLVEVVRRHVGGHADRDAGGAVEQQVRQPRRHPGRLLQGAVEVRVPVDRALGQLAQQHLGDRREFGFGVAHRRERFRVVAGAEVALALDQRIAVRERLRHQHHRLVARAVAVRVVLADHVADGARGFLRLRARIEPELAHREDDAALHRLEAVAEERQGAVEHDVHRIVEVGALGVLAQRNLFEAVEHRADGIGHGAMRTQVECLGVILPGVPARAGLPAAKPSPEGARGLPELRRG